MAANRSLVRSLISVQKLLHCPAIPPSQSTIIGGNNGVRRFSTEITESATKSKENEEKKEIWALKWALAAEMTKNIQNGLELDNKKFNGKLKQMEKSVDKITQKEKFDRALVMKVVKGLMKDTQNVIEQEREKWAQASKSLASVPNLLIPKGIENLESSKGYNDELQTIEPKIRRIQQKIETATNFWLHISKAWEHFSLAVAVAINATEQANKGPQASKPPSSVSKDLEELHDDLRKVAAKREELNKSIA